MTVTTVRRGHPARHWYALAALLVAGGSAAAAVPQAARASHVAYPPGAFSLALSLSLVEPGATVEVRAAGCSADVTVQFAIADTDVSASATCVAATADQLGGGVAPAAATLSLQAPSQVGVYTVRATELGGQRRSATAVLTVAKIGVAAPTTTSAELPPTGGGGGGGSGGVLPKSGSDTGPLVATAVATLVLGGGLWVVARRRRQRITPIV